MDSTHQQTFSLRTTRLTCLITTLLLLLSSNSRFVSANSLTISNDDNNKVSLDFYYESLCPYCSRFMVNHLYKLFDTGIINITNLNLVPYGNAKIKSNTTVICQHGPYECVLNNVEACAIDAWPQVNEHFPFIYCVENLVYQDKETKWESCFETLSLDPKPILECYNSERPFELALQYAAETNNLQPPHKYVPWVVVNGQPLYDDYEDFLSFICKAYEGTAKPSTCSEVSLKGIQEKKSKLMKPVSYTGWNSKLSKIRTTMISWIDQLI